MPVEERRRVLIFVHGMIGSQLVDKKSGKLLWLSPWTLLKACFRGTHKIAPPLTWSADGRRLDEDSITAQTTQDFATWFVGGWATWCAELRRTGEVDVRDFVWDWRRPMDEVCDTFLEWIQQQELGLDCQAVLVTFATGCHIAWPAVSNFPELFKAWITVGSGLYSGNGIIQPITDGWFMDPALPLPLVNGETLSQFAMPYAYLKAAGEPTGVACEKTMFQSLTTGKEVEVDLFDPRVWEKSELGIFAARKKQGREVSIGDRIHLDNCLAAAKRFREKYFVREGKPTFDDEAFLAHPRERYGHLDIVAYGCENRETHSGWYVDDDGRVRLDKGSIMGKGDGSVTNWSWQTVPGGLKTKVVTTDTVHQRLMTDERICELAAEALGLGYTRPAPAESGGSSGVKLAIAACAVAMVAALYLRQRK